MERYSKNEHALSPEENRLLRQKSAAVVGLGGLGGFVTEFLARLGVGRLTLIDGDVFEASNLNRQLNSYPDALGEPKAPAAAERVTRVNPDIELRVEAVRLTGDNAKDLLQDHDIIVDCLDNIATRLLLERAAEELGIPLVHGAIRGWNGQVTVVMPGNRTLSRLYRNQEQEVSAYWGNPVFIVAATASLETAEAVKVLLGKDDILERKLLVVDLSTPEFTILEI